MVLNSSSAIVHRIWWLSMSPAAPPPRVFQCLCVVKAPDWKPVVPTAVIFHLKEIAIGRAQISKRRHPGNSPVCVWGQIAQELILPVARD